MKASKKIPGDVRDYTRELTVKARPEILFDAIATLEGIRGWWTHLVSGSGEAGGTIHLEFEGLDEHIDLRVITLQRPTHIEWSLVEHTSLDEWEGTSLRFEVSPRGANASCLAFQHVGLSPRLECYNECRAGWDHFLGSVVAFAEHGEGAPFRSERRRQ